jgi:hypothetical protein
MFQLDLKVIRALMDPNFVIWNITAACKRVDRSEVVHFKRKHPKISKSHGAGGGMAQVDALLSGVDEQRLKPRSGRDRP